MRRMVEGLLTWLLLTAAASAAAVLDPRDPLSRWLDTEVAPQLAERLGRHPDFRHAVIDFMTVTDGAPSADATRLHAAVKQQLRQHLLMVEGVQLHLESTPSACAPVRDIDYAIGIEVDRGSGRDTRITVALLDLNRRVWVSGLGSSWHGRLTDAQRRAHEEPVQRAAPGSAGSPFAVGEATAVAASLLEQIRCVLPRGVDGGVYLETPAGPQLEQIALELRRRLLLTPLFVPAEREQDAEWLLRVHANRDFGGTAELVVELIDRGSDARQRLAAAFVERGTRTAQNPATEPGVSSGPVAQPAHNPLSPLTVTVVQRAGVCRDNRDNACAEVRLELAQASHLLVFSTSEGAVSVPQCRAEASLREAGEYRFRLPVGTRSSAQRPATGFYAIAIRDREAALDLQRIVAAAPGACGTPADTQRDAWIARLGAALQRYGHAVHWRAVHLDEEARQL